MVHALDNRTRELFEGDRERTHLDYVCAWVESGRTMLDLSRELLKEAGIKDMLPSMLGDYLRRTWPDDLGAASANYRLVAARRVGAHAKAEGTEDIAAEMVGDSADAARQRNRIGAAQWLAERWNKEELGVNKGPQVQLNVSVRDLHLDAMRARSTAAVRSVSQPVLSQSDTVALPAGGEAATPSATAALADLM